MRTFEVGKRYGESAVVFEITKRTAEKKSGRKFTTGEAEKYFSQAVKQ